MYGWLSIVAAGVAYLTSIWSSLVSNPTLFSMKSIMQSSVMSIFLGDSANSDTHTVASNNGDMNYPCCVNCPSHIFAFPGKWKIVRDPNEMTGAASEADILKIDKEKSNVLGCVMKSYNHFDGKLHSELEFFQPKCRPAVPLRSFRKSSESCSRTVLPMIKKCCQSCGTKCRISSSCLFRMHVPSQHLDMDISGVLHLLPLHNMRPAYPTNINQVHNSSRSEVMTVHSEGAWLDLERCIAGEIKMLFSLNGIQSIQSVGLTELTQDAESKGIKGQWRRTGLPIADAVEQLNVSYGTLDPSSVFCLGLTFGLVFSMRSNKKQVDDINEQFKHNQSLTHDLQEELAKKDLMPVEELANETSVPEVSQFCSGHASCELADSSPSTVKAKLDEGFERLDLITASASAHRRVAGFKENKCTKDLNFDTKADIEDKSFNKIEAELEAELGRLNINVDTCSLLSDSSEIDADLIGDGLSGELNPDIICGDHIHCGGKSSGTTNYDPGSSFAVCPKELSLRLYEIVQSRLEEHIVELESELNCTKRRLQLMECEKECSFNSQFEEQFVQKSASTNSVDLFAKSLAVRHVGVGVNVEVHKMQDNWQITSNMPNLGFATVDSLIKSLSDAEDRCNDDQVAKRSASENDSWSSNDIECMVEDVQVNNLVRQIKERTRQGSPAVLHVKRMLEDLNVNLI